VNALYWISDISAPYNTYTLSLHDALPISGDLGSPVTADGVLFVPLRAIAEALGAEVTWDQDERLARVALPDRTVVFRIGQQEAEDRKSTRLNSSHVKISYAVFCLKQRTFK